MSKKIMIDVDTGVDDAHALMLALSSPNIDVVAITCVAGNVDVDKVILNTLKVLKVCNRTDIPVYRGATSALTSEGFTAKHYHGSDGLGDTGLEIDVDTSQLQPGHATRGLIDMSLKYPGDITLVALGPLTNIALALKLDPEFGLRLKDVTIMGGNIEGMGNTAYACAEFNFGCDPEAAQLVLSSLHVPTTIFPWEINLSELAGQPWEWFDTWVQHDTAKGRFIKAYSRGVVHTQREVRKNLIFRSCDMSAMATVVDSGIITESAHVYATVETKGEFTRGMMVCDWRGIFNKDKNVTIVKRIDTAKARELFDRIVQ